MFEIFKSRTCFYIFIAFIFYFLQTVVSYGNIVKTQFQQEESVALQEKNVASKVVNVDNIHNILEQDRLAFGKVEQVFLFETSSGKSSLLFNVIWGGVSIGSLIASLATGNTVGIVVSIISLLI
ncbi:hypothetical protein V4P56_04460 [Bartonella sp. B35(2025)]